MEGEYDDNTLIPVRIETPSLLIYWAKRRGGETIDNNPIAISAKKAYQAMARSGQDTEGRPHALSVDDMIGIIQNMNRPIYIVRQSDGRYLEIVKYTTGSGNKAIAVLEIGDNKDAVYMNGFEGGLYNILVTTFPPDSGKVSEILSKKSNHIVYDAKKDASQRTSGNTVPSVLNDTPFFTEKDTTSSSESQEKNFRKQVRRMETVYDEMGERERLVEENRELAEDVEQLKALVAALRQDKKQMPTLTHGSLATDSSVDAAASWLLDRVGVTHRGNKAELKKRLQEFHGFIATSEDLSWESVMGKAEGIAQWLNDKKAPVIDPFYGNVKSAIREAGLDKQLVESGLTYSVDSKAYELAKGIAENEAKGVKTDAVTLLRLFQEEQVSLSEQNISDVKETLIRHGYTEADAQTVAGRIYELSTNPNVLFETAVSDDPTGKTAAHSALERKMLEKNEAVAEALASIIRDGTTQYQRMEILERVSSAVSTGSRAKTLETGGKSKISAKKSRGEDGRG